MQLAFFSTRFVDSVIPNIRVINAVPPRRLDPYSLEDVWLQVPMVYENFMSRESTGKRSSRPCDDGCSIELDPHF